MHPVRRHPAEPRLLCWPTSVPQGDPAQQKRILRLEQIPMGISTASCRGGLRETILIGIIDSHGYRAAAPQSGNARPAAAGRSQRVRRARHRARHARRSRPGGGLHQRGHLPAVSLEGGISARPVRAIRRGRARRRRSAPGAVVHSPHDPVRGPGDARPAAAPSVCGGAGRSARRRVARRPAPQGARPRAAGGARRHLVTVILAAAVLLGVGFLLVSAVLRRIRAGPLRLPSDPIPDRWREIVDESVPLAGSLSPEERERLLRLVQLFLSDKHFEGCGGLTVTEEMKVTIAAEACLLLLHLEGPCYPGLRTVLVYPHGFVPKFARPPTAGGIVQPPAPLLGESWGDGVVVISWDDTLNGARDPGDGVNVVLHEFAHQLDDEDGSADGAPVLSGGALRAWGRVLSDEFERLRQDAAADRPSALDPYGASNKAEFFAVATETFFEKPVQLEREHPELYEQLKRFYRQDPARRAPAPPAPPPPGAAP